MVASFPSNLIHQFGLSRFLADAAFCHSRCWPYKESFLTFLDNSHTFLEESLIQEFEKVLREENLLNATICISLSGGVDSMVHLCMLWILQQAGIFKGYLKALHLRHSNREEALQEESWVTLLCKKIGVELYGHHIEIERPHGNITQRDTGISREDYEEVCRDIRFKMYQETLNINKNEDVRHLILIGHHEDDRDENRLAELAKGNVVRIDGMMRWTNQYGIEVLRPLLHVRKSAIFDLATKFHLFYMHDSTPVWSKRGWIRRVLDINERDLLPALKELGDASEKFADTLDERLLAWKQDAIYTFVYEELHIGCLKLESLLSLASELQDDLDKLVLGAHAIAGKWNPMYQEYAAQFPDVTCPIQPIQLEKNMDLGALVFSRAYYSLQNNPEMTPVTQGIVAARRALTHTWQSLIRARGPMCHGKLQKTLPCIYRKSDQRLYFTTIAGEQLLKKQYAKFP